MMRWVLLFLLLALLLAGCNETGGETSGSETPNPAFETLDPAGQAGGDVLGAGEPVVIDAPVLASTMLVYDVGSLDGQLGDAAGLVLDGTTGQLRYLAVETVGPAPARTLLLPWGSFQIVALPPAENLQGAEPAPQVWLKVDGQAAGEAPEIDPAALEDLENLAEGWDQETVSYWSNVLPNLPVSGQPASGRAPEEDEADGNARTSLFYVHYGALRDIDFDVRSPGNEELGEIRDFVIDRDGQVVFAVLEPQSTNGLGQGLAPVPWNTLVWSPSVGEFTLNVSPETLAQAPRLDPNDLPDMTVPGWEQDWRDFWESQSSGILAATPTEGETAAVFRLGRLVDQPVVTTDGQMLGRLVDWVVDLAGQSVFAVLATGERTLPLPLQALSWQEGSLLFLLDPAAVDGAPAYDSLADLEGDPDWFEGALDYWSGFAEIHLAETALDPQEALERVRAVKLLETPIVDVDGGALGAVADIILGSQGVVDYLTVQAGGLFRPVPWMNFEYDPQAGQLVYLDDVVRLADAPGFASLEDLAGDQPGWDAEIRQYWGMKDSER
jgi:sporulation protein YlmC with PRC-barrel domain